jgi:predicted nucleotidyltransferase
LFSLDEDLIQVAAEPSGALDEAISDGDLHRAIAQLPVEEQTAFLLRLAKGEPHLSLALKRRLGVLGGVSQGAMAKRRSVGALLEAAESLREHRHRERVAAAEAKRVAEFKALAGQEDETWAEVDVLIQRSQAKAYAEAVRLLKKLQDLAE